MGIQVSWDNDQRTVLRLDFSGRWSWEEYAAAGNIIRRTAASISHPVGLVVNFGQSSLPKGGVPAEAFSNELLSTPANVSTIVIVGGKQLAWTLTNIMKRTLLQPRKHIQLAETVGDARLAIHAQHANTDSLLRNPAHTN